ncbi:MAG: ChaN family lipoprotein [Paracoccaceae bacterium]|nr:MAG: ChaN family lipoprotein [Paracoccaceae bacterium]
MRTCLALLLWPLAAGAGPVLPDDLLRLPSADVVILGEVHDNAAHHDHQARAVAAIGPAALVFEMLTPEQAAAAAGVDRSDREALDAALGWTGSGWPDFALYHPILAAAPAAAIIGGALPRAEVRRAMTEGADAVFGAGAAAYGLAEPLPPDDQAAREAAQQEAHCNALPAEMLPGFVAAQRLRDAVLARTALAALAEHGAPVVVIAGTGHARRDEGIPAAMAGAAPDVRVLSVGQVESDPGPDAPFDLWIVTDPAPRDDPCAAFATPPAQGG